MTRRARRGFTLVELLVVIAIIGVLVGLLLPAVQAAREAARRMSCSNNLKQLGLALHNYHNTYNAIAPLRNWTELPASSWNSMTVSWRARLLPFMEQESLHDQIDYGLVAWWRFDLRPNSTWTANQTVVPAFRCPSDGGKGGVTWTAPDGTKVSGSPTSADYASTNYFASVGPDSEHRWDGAGLGFFDGIRYYSPQRRGGVKDFADITDGLSNTVMISEAVIGHPKIEDNPNGNHTVAGNYQAQANTFTANDNKCPSTPLSKSATNGRGNSWLRGYSGNDLSFTTLMAPNSKLWDCAINSGWATFAARSQHPGGVQVTAGDGSVRFVAESIDLVQWRALGGSHDGVVAAFDQ